MTSETADHESFQFDDESEPSFAARIPASRKRKQPPRRTPDTSFEQMDEDELSKERLQKVLASAGLASRRHCEEYIVDGRVTVDGKVVTTLGIKVDPEKQRVCVDGERIKIERRQYFLVNKPAGVISTNADPDGRPRVVDLLPPWKGRLFTVGRLDEGSEGLLLVTNDGDLAHRLAHPKFQVERVYRALVAGVPSDEVLRQLLQGLYFAEGKFRVRSIRRIKSSAQASTLELVLTEGQNREIRRMLARVGHKVMKLKRIAFGPLKLGELETAAYRPLTPVELKVLQQFASAEPKRRFTPPRSTGKTAVGKPVPGKPRAGASPRSARQSARPGTKSTKRPRRGSR